MSAANLRIFFQLRGLLHHKYSLFSLHTAVFHFICTMILQLFYHSSAFVLSAQNSNIYT